MKKFLGLIIVATMILGMSTSAFASVDGSNVEETCPEGWSNLGNGVWISDEMSFNEMAEYHAEKTGMPIAEAKSELKEIEKKRGWYRSLRS